MKFDWDFWGDQGRIAILEKGPHAGGYAFIHPETRAEWWVVIVDPSPYPNAPLEFFLEGNDELEHLLATWGPRWIPADEDAEIERSRFGRRPFTGPPSWMAKLPR